MAANDLVRGRRSVFELRPAFSFVGSEEKEREVIRPRDARPPAARSITSPTFVLHGSGIFYDSRSGEKSKEEERRKRAGAADTHYAWLTYN